VPEIEAGMGLRGLHHISGITDDLDAAGSFLEAALGLSIVKRTTNRDDPSQLHYFWAGRDAAGAVAPRSSYTLFGWPQHWNRARPGAGQATHVAFRAGDADDLAAWREHLAAAGRDVSPIREDEHWRSISFRAPDGITLQFATDLPAAPG
jgi:glyoxalase family protein